MSSDSDVGDDSEEDEEIAMSCKCNLLCLFVGQLITLGFFGVYERFLDHCSLAKCLINRIHPSPIPPNATRVAVNPALLS